MLRLAPAAAVAPVAAAWLAVAALATVTSPAMATTPTAATATEPAWMAEIAPLAQSATQAAFGGRSAMRVEVVPGTLDPRLNLAPCNKVQPYLPAGHRAWGRTRVGLRCVDGPVAWNVSMPITVKVFAPALVARQALSAGTVLGAEHLETGEVDWAAAESPALGEAAPVAGRTLARPLAPGQALRESDLRKRQWFDAGDPVRLVVVGNGFSISGEGVALTPGLEGQLVRVRTEGGKVVSGKAAGDRRVEVQL
ncbi:MAG: flagellar basal body P-ring formation chaperone FlgA [Rubrivivax sp.]